MENLQTAAAEKVQIQGQFVVHHLNQRKSSFKHLPRILHFIAHQFAELRSKIAVGDHNLFHTEAFHVSLRQVDAAFSVVHGHILPKIGKLERGTGVVGETETFCVAISADVKNEM